MHIIMRIIMLCVFFLQILSLGSLVKYTDVGTEAKHGIVMKHFADKNRTLVVDRLTRRRQTVSRLVVNFTIISRFLQRPRKLSCRNQLIHSCSVKTESVGSLGN